MLYKGFNVEKGELAKGLNEVRLFVHTRSSFSPYITHSKLKTGLGLCFV